jgi:hypothetical protein
VLFCFAHYDENVFLYSERIKRKTAKRKTAKRKTAKRN